MQSLARQLLSLTAMVGSLAIAVSAPLLAGCPIPFPSDIEDQSDAGLNTTPVITSASPEDLAFGGAIVVVDRGDPRVVTLSLRDTDVGDTLYLRTYRDYTAALPTVFLNDVEVPPTGEALRLRDVSLSPWCAGVAPTDEDQHILEVLVADRAFLECTGTPVECAGQPQFRELPAGAQSSARTWNIKCRPPK
jgi:hypothetical protein